MAMTTFDEAALSKLTAKIDSRLAEPQSKIGSKIGGNTSKKENSNKKRKQTTDQDAEPLKSPPKKRSRNEGKTSKDKPVTTKSKKTSADAKTKKPVDRDINVLLDEIKALGGSEEDLRLVEDIDSDEEDVVGNEKDADAKLRAELARFAADLGFEKVAPDFAAAESESEEQDDESRDEADAGEDNNADHNNRSDQAPAPAPDLNSKPRSLFKGKTIFEPRADWHAVPLNPLPKPSSDEVAPYMAAIAALKTYAKTLLDEDGDAYRTTVSSSSSHKFMSTIMSSGTMSDRVSALTLAIQESPVHNIKALESLMGFASKRSRDQALSALAALVDLLGPGMILPSDRRLHPFSSQVGLVGTLQHDRIKSWSVGQPLPGKITKEHLILWVFEDWLKDSYFKMIQSLETWCDDEVEYARTKAVDLVFALLRDKPEQESNLLRLLVNKLGDRERKIASRASYLLLQLLNVHPNMKKVVIQTVEQEVLFRPGQNVRAKYYTINTLNQTILSTKEPEIAENLLRIYFNLFVALLKNGELNQLDGPSSHGPKDKVKAKNRQGGKPERNGKGAKKGAAPPTDLEATEKLVSAILTGINRALPFSKADQSTVESHLNTLFRITHSSNFNTSIQALMLIQQLSASRQIATERFYRTLYESLLDPRLATSSKQALYLNLLYRSLKADIDVRRVKAFVKRMLQILNLQQPSFVCGILFLIIELSGVFPDLKTLFTEPEENDWEEVAQDAGATDAPIASTDPHSQHARAPITYDGRKRDPEYSNAHRSCLWELLPFLKHFHPSVEVYASNLLAGRRTTQKPELASHTLIAFLDKFVYRNAKTADSSRGISIMQPVAAGGQGHVLVSNKPSAKDGASLNTSAFWNKKSEDVAKDEVFFHEYFAQIGKPRQAERAQKSKDAKTASDDEEGEADEEDIWNALVSSRPEVQGDSDSDPEFDDLMGLDDSEDDFKEAMEDSEEEEGLDLLDESDISSDEEDEGGAELEPAVEEAKEEKSESQQKRAKRKAMKNLPTFASAEDYAEMLAQDDDEL